MGFWTKRGAIGEIFVLLDLVDEVLELFFGDRVTQAGETVGDIREVELGSN